MESFKKILCPMDFSDFSQRALSYAAAFAEKYASKLVIYHCLRASAAPVVGLSPIAEFEWQPSSLQLQERLQEYLVPFMRHKLNVTTKVEHGDPAAQILETAAEEDADLIVMGTHGLTGYEAILMGSVTNKVLHKTRIPVLSVCNPTKTILSGDPDEPLLIGKILCAVDPAHINLKMLSHAMFLARSNRSTIFFYTVNSNEAKGELDNLYDLIVPEKEDSCRVEFLETVGHPVDEIVKAIRDYEIDLAVMGHRSKMSSTWEGLGSVTLRVVPQSKCPVMIVRD